ncbi:MAG: LysR family transcriptional regulator [Alphaproteobacteria bacterium]|uniref:LysR family transcriptional regulator n=1 Tax=Pseudorhizobium pelagicum TaxID=1509405 RepID=UPI001D2C0B46|nr:LysR family transcriptional regulator [Alphaproteobacteria bacterium]MBU1550146.1 LysR family transcriptional regulator [Alphaproteobacteria bacterium]MBU2337933.1 LysR family transcriptional regulator [Alphaproteobacteria bacterium]MBU2387913.1 LysR family transcriptional regulator [Alphaproteobacteria bacterium]
MDQLSAMRAFVRVVETGNFTRAARTLDMSKTTVTNLVQNLEGHLRAKLLNRTTRQVAVTTEGALYYERAAQFLSDLEELDGSISSSQSQPSGRLRVEMAGAFADLIVIPSLCSFYCSYPQITLDIGVGDRLIDYVAENVDCALRAGTPTDQSLIARKVGEISLRTYVSPGFIQMFGMPEHPRDLEAQFFSVGYLNAQAGRVLPMEFRRGEETLEITPRYAVSVNDSRSYIAAAVSGMGVAQAPQFMARDAVEKGQLVEVLTDWEREPLPLYIVYPRTRHLGNKVRVFVDWLVKLLKESAARDADRPLAKKPQKLKEQFEPTSVAAE